MVNVKIISDNFMMGQTKIPKNKIVPMAPVVARFVVSEGTGQIVDAPDLDELLGTDKPAPKKKAPPKKKATYKTRDVKAN